MTDLLTKAIGKNFYEIFIKDLGNTYYSVPVLIRNYRD